MKAINATTNREGHVRVNEGIPSLWIALKPGEDFVHSGQYNLIVLGEDDKKGKIMFGIPNSHYDAMREIRPDEKYRVFDYGMGIFSFEPEEETEGSCLLLLEAMGAERIKAEEGAKPLAYYCGQKGRSAMMLVFKAGQVLKIHQKKKGTEPYPTNNILLRNEGGQLAFYSEISPYRDL